MKIWLGFLCGVVLCARANEPVPEVMAHVLRPVIVSEFGEEGESRREGGRVILEPGAPEGARILPGTSAFFWVPRRHHAPSTNVARVRLGDEHGITNTASFRIIVNHYVEITAGATVVQAGEGGGIWLDLFSSAPLNGFSCLLHHPPGVLTGLALDPVAPQLASALLAPATNDCLFLNFVLLPHQILQGTQRLGRLRFRTDARQSSSFIPVAIRDLTCSPLQAGVAPSKLMNDGEVATLGDAPLLRAMLGPDGKFQALLFGRTGISYSLEAAPDLNRPTWSFVRRITLAGPSEVITDLGTEQLFYRVRQEP